MKRRRILLILLGCVASITLAVLIWPREREPEYNGIPLSAWLDRGRRDPEFISAIKHMRTNALPFLIRAIQYEEPGWRVWFGRATSHWPRSLLNNRLGHWLSGLNLEIRASSSVFAYWVLGADADPALDELKRTERDSKNLAVSGRASACIALINERMEQ